MTTGYHGEKPPCAYARVLYGILALILGLVLYVKGDQAQTAMSQKWDHDTLIELKADLKYIRAAVERMEKPVRP